MTGGRRREFRFSRGRGEKVTAITVPPMRQVFTRLLRHPAPTPEEIAAVDTRVLRRNEESRIFDWHKAPRDSPRDG